ncbi:L,D-transpeptidase family protein [Bacillus cereus]|uniref:L,D-transpeptidase family protein n=1 Tax=Bacillus cereus TaxID=1396 RepID=UPI00307A74E8
MKKMMCVIFSIVMMFTTMFTQISYAATEKQFIIINKKTNKLAFYQNGELVKIYSVATGKKPNLTPEGRFKIVNKIKNRPFYKENIPGGSPRNPLGDRWMGINARGTWGTTYGIHGNNNERSIGKHVSSGCIRMHNKEIRSLFNVVKTNTPVVITTSNQSFDEIAEKNGYALNSKVKKFNKVITTLNTSKLYTSPSFKKYTGTTLDAQSVQAYEKAGNFIKVKTWMGPKWAYVTEYIEGKEVRVDKNITTLETTNVRKKPFSDSTVIKALPPQTIFAYKKVGSWYKVKTSDGPYYISSHKVVEGIKSKFEKEIVLKNKKPVYENIFDKKPITILSPQSVEAFERIGNYYHIYTSAGTAWVQN